VIVSKKLTIPLDYQGCRQTKEPWLFDFKTAYERLCFHFQIHSLDGFGMRGLTAAIGSAGALLAYVSDELNLPTAHISSIYIVQPSQFMALDRATQRHLELVTPLHENSTTVCDLLDRTETPMGARCLRDWILHPLLSVSAISARQEKIQLLLDHPKTAEQIRSQLEKIRDLERLAMRVETGNASPRDLLALRISLEPLPQLNTALDQLQWQRVPSLQEICATLNTAIVETPPLKLSDGGIFKPGYHAELDHLRELKSNSQEWMATYQTSLREETNIKTLKVGYTQAFGYYIEISRGRTLEVPASFHRRQTLVNAERFITPELKEFEHTILSAEDKISALENELFEMLRKEIAAYAAEIRSAASAIARIDVFLSLADIARERNYIIDDSTHLQIVAGRHPILEIALEERFTPNDLEMNDDLKLIVITGPNMAGKSTYLRQVALLTLLAQIGSFVPAQTARIGIVDKLFSRIGASDDLARGQSTFMVEMSETANILNNVTDRSLVILDEIGRGTSTYDGIAIAWAVAEYLLTTPGRKAKTLFATHYWELCRLENEVSGAANFNVAVAESESGIAFLHKIVPGGTDRSYGIHVARLAGLPQTVIHRAEEFLSKTTKISQFQPVSKSRLPQTEKEPQLELF
jgi:DNA mismatch repair protein MutS